MELDSAALIPSSVWYVTSFHSDVGRITPSLHIPLQQVVSRKREKGSCPTYHWISERKVLMRMSGCNFYRNQPFLLSVPGPAAINIPTSSYEVRAQEIVLYSLGLFNVLGLYIKRMLNS